MTGGSLASRIVAAPPPHNAATGAAAAEGFAGATADLLAGAAGSSPYLAKLIRQEREWLEAAVDAAPGGVMAAIVDEIRATVADAQGQREAMSALRRGKARGALLIALADLGGVWDLGAVTGALSDLADAALGAASRWALERELAKGSLPGLGPEDAADGAGYSVIAMGKLGARELNFSSDIDLICLFDETRFEEGDYAEAKAGYIRATRTLVKLLSEITSEGYVFRTDLRLRPSPSTTPVCMAMEAAERYYESVGRTWERAAHIKARAAAGDVAAGERYLDTLAPFVWRRHLDFAAIEEAHDMRRKIRAEKGRGSRMEVSGHDIKLGAGGIREIEFFAQTQQLIMGGREPSLRVRGTLAALDAEVAAGLVDGATRDSLAADYVANRELEHRLQMVEDAQTQTVPVSPEGRARVAALSGWTDVAAWEADIAQRLRRVHRTCEAFFAPAERRGLDTSEAHLAELGFARPGDAEAILHRWTDGTIPATRSERARLKFEAVAPEILEALGGAASPDDAIALFDRFLSGLPGGVQLFSLFEANPHLLDLIVEICAAAPRLATYLGRNAQVLDALLDRNFFEPIPDREALAGLLAERLDAEHDYERALDAARRWTKELRFRLGVQVLRGIAGAAEAGQGFSDVADAALAGLLPRVVQHFARRHGPPPGRGLAILAMGKLGSREMTAGSDLDLIVVCDPGDAEASDGPKPLVPGVYFARLTQALIAAVSAPTAEGVLYEVDMRLRPSGRKGPVATTLESFRNYHMEEAWTWERMALTRARAVAGDRALIGDVEAVIADALGPVADPDRIVADAADMRRRMVEARPGDRANPWALKHAAGGIQDCEFVLQAGAVVHGLGRIGAPREAIPALVTAGWIDAEEGDAIAAALDLAIGLQQIERVALEAEFDPEKAGAGLLRAVARTLGREDVAALGADLAARQARAAAVAGRLFGSWGDEG